MLAPLRVGKFVAVMDAARPRLVGGMKADFFIILRRLKHCESVLRPYGWKYYTKNEIQTDEHKDE